MNSPTQVVPPARLSRRSFLKRTAAVTAVSALPVERFAFGAANNDTLKLAAVGVGGRGSGAVSQALNTSNLGPIKLVAIAEVHQDRLDNALKNFQSKNPESVDVLIIPHHVEGLGPTL